MEMKTFKTIEVLAFSDKSPIKVSLPVQEGMVDGKQLYSAVTEALGIQSGSLKCFTICDGHESPLRVYKDGEQIPVGGCQLSFQRWCFDPQVIDTTVDKDEAAGSLLYQQAVHVICSGRLLLSKEDEAKLEEFSRPDFTLMRDYMRLCEAQKEFHVHTFPECVLVSAIHVSSNLQFDVGSKVTLSVGRRGIQISSAYRIHGQHSLHGNWTSVRSWLLHPSRKQVSFDLDVQTDGKTSKKLSFTVETARCQFVVDVIKAVIQQIQQEDSQCPKFYIDMVTQGSDGSTHWQNALYNYRK